MQKPVRSQWELETVEVLRPFIDHLFDLHIPTELLALVAAYGRGNVWDRKNCGIDFTISDENPSIVRKRINFCSPQLSQVAAADAIFETGRRYSFLVEILEFGHVSVGAIPGAYNVRCGDRCLRIGWGQVGGWEWIEGIFVRHGRTKYLYGSGSQTASLWQKGDILGVHVDFSEKTVSLDGHGTISFSRNGETEGIAFRDVLPPVKPAICTYTTGCRLRIVNISSH